MSSAAFDQQAADWIDMLENIERRRTGQKQIVVRRTLARTLGCAPGTIENVVRGRTKGVRGWLAERARTLVIRELEREILRLQAELSMARQCGARLDADEVLSAMSAIKEARTLINQAVN